MKAVRLLSVALVLAAAGCAAEPPAVTVRTDESLTPDDLGVGKYVFEAVLPAGKVLVVRCTETAGGKTRGVNEDIRNVRGGLARMVVMVFDPSQFPFGDGKAATVKIKTPG